MSLNPTQSPKQNRSHQSLSLIEKLKLRRNHYRYHSPTVSATIDWNAMNANHFRYGYRYRYRYDLHYRLRSHWHCRCRYH